MIAFIILINASTFSNMVSEKGDQTDHYLTFISYFNFLREKNVKNQPKSVSIYEEFLASHKQTNIEFLTNLFNNLILSNQRFRLQLKQIIKTNSKDESIVCEQEQSINVPKGSK